MAAREQEKPGEEIVLRSDDRNATCHVQLVAQKPGYVVRVTQPEPTGYTWTVTFQGKEIVAAV